MTNDERLDIIELVGAELASSWFQINPKMYYVKGLLYGLIGYYDSDDGIKYISATTKYPHQSFTFNMIKDIRKMYNQYSICLITDDKSYVDDMKKSLSRFDFRYEVRDNVLYSFNDKDM